jgi:hypothetical protein
LDRDDACRLDAGGVRQDDRLVSRLTELVEALRDMTQDRVISSKR